MAHSIVLTSSMASTNNDAFLYVEGTAKTDLDNGRLVNVDFGKKEVSYASDVTKELGLKKEDYIETLVKKNELLNELSNNLHYLESLNLKNIQCV